MGDQPILPLQQAIFGKLDKSLQAVIYRLNAAKGDVLSLTAEDWSSIDRYADLHLYAPTGQRIEPKSTIGNVRQFAIPVSGQYGLVIDREPPALDRSNVEQSEVDYNESKDLDEDFLFQFTASLTTGNSSNLPSALPIELNELVSVGALAANEKREYAFELDSSQLLVLRPVQGTGNWTLWSETGSPIRWGDLNSFAVLHASQFVSDFGTPNGVAETHSQPGRGGLQAGKYRLTISDQMGNQPIQFQIIDARTNSIPLVLGQTIQGQMDVAHTTTLVRFLGKTGQETSFETLESPSPLASAILISPDGSLIALKGDGRLVFEKSISVRLPMDGEYLILLSAFEDSLPLNPFSFTLKSKMEKEQPRPTFDLKNATWNNIEAMTVTDLHSYQYRVNIAAGEQVYFDGMNANARVRVDYFDSNGTNLFSLKNSELNRMLPVARYAGEHLFTLEPIDLIASVPRDRVGGGGFRPGALPIIITATDNGTAYRADLNANGCAVLDVHGVGNTVVDIRNMVGESFTSVTAPGCIQHDSKYDAARGRPLVPNGDAASVQDAVSALVDLGALVVGIGTGRSNNAENPTTPGSLLSELARLTGTINSSNQSILNGTVPPQAPIYVALSGDDSDRMKKDLLEAINATLDYAGYDVDVVIRDNSGVSANIAPSSFHINSKETKSVDLELVGDGGSHEFYLEFLRHGTNIVLGRMPIGINYVYTYNADAFDADGDTITYTLVGENHGATIDASTGEINWLPPASGKYAFTVQADDGRGGKTLQQWEVNADPRNLDNHAPTLSPIANQTAVVQRPFELQTIAADSDSDVLSFGLIAGSSIDSLPEGMAIDQRSGLIRWTPTVSQVGCPYQITVTVNDGRGGEARRTFQIVAFAQPEYSNHRPTISSTPASVAIVGERYSYEIVANDIDGDPLQFKLTSSPKGMILDTVRRTLVWIPALSDAGTQNVNIQVSDGQGGVAYQNYFLTVVPTNQPPEFLNVEPQFVQVATPWTFEPDVIDPNGDPLQFKKVSGPDGLTVSLDGIVTWTPSDLGTYQFIIQADDRRNGKTIQPFTVDVLSNVSQPPVIASSPLGPAIIGNLWQYEISAFDPENDPLNYQLIDPPAGMKMGTSPNGKPEVQWVPASLAGNYQVHIRVTDDVQRKHGTSQRFTLPVTQWNQPPIIRSVPLDAIAGSTWTYAFNAIDPDGDALTYEFLVKQPGMTIDSNGLILWTPTLADQLRFGATRTTDPVVKIRVSDGHGGEAIEEVFTKVNPSPNDGEHPFVANNPTGPIYLNRVWTHQLDGIDPDGKSDKITYSYVQLRKNGVAVSDAGAISVSPTGLVSINATASNGFTLDDPSYEIVVRLTDDEGSQTEYKMQARFRTKNDWPTFGNTPIGELIPGRTWSFLSIASDLDGNAIAFSKTADSVGTVNTNGAIVFTPPASATDEAYPLILNATDGSLAENGIPIHRQQATTLITTQHAAGFPRITSHPSVAIVLSDDASYRYQVRSLDSNLAYRLSTGPQGMAIDTNGLVTWQPKQFGNFPVVIEITNASQQTTFQRFTVSAIRPFLLNEPPEIVSKPVGPAARDAEYIYQAKANDLNGDVLEYFLVYGPPWMTIQPNTGKISGTPTTAGQAPVKIRVREVKANDNEEFEATQSFVLTILQNAPPRITSAAPVNARVTIGGSSFQTNVTATDPNIEDRSGLRYSLVDPLDGAQIQSVTGALTYSTADLAQRGKHSLTVRVTDPDGATDEQSFTVQALGPTNAAPEFLSSPRKTLPAGIVYALELKATDLDGDDVTYELVNPLSGMRLENGNVFVWTPPRSLVTSATVPAVSIRFRAKSARDLLTTEQQTSVIITKAVENTPPKINTNPRKAAVVGFEYIYQPSASDVDNDVVYWKLDNGPSSIDVEPATGRMTWKPTSADLGTHSIVLTATDGYGGIAKQSFSIEVRAGNTPPLIESVPYPYAQIGQTYTYAVKASDVDEDTLTYLFASDAASASAQGWSLNAFTGQLTLRPTFTHGAQQSVTIAVRDGRGGQTEQEVTLNIFSSVVNKPPVFTNSLPDYWLLGGSTQYRLNAVDTAPRPNCTYFSIGGITNRVVDR